MSRKLNQPSPLGPLSQKERGRKRRALNYRGGFSHSHLVDSTRDLRQRETGAEKALWQLIRNRKFRGLKFRRQHQIGPFIVDFYCDELKLIIELDGSVHDEREQKERDFLREKSLKSAGYKVLRFKNIDALYRPERILNAIGEIVSLLTSSPSGEAG